ncbi:MAG: alpha/beta hydrolase [Nitrospirota bacterium]|nr:alpha/beta hydrolase [Nitrospirota bacterium]
MPRHVFFLTAALTGLLLSACGNLLLYPEAQLLGTPDQIGMAYQETTFTAADGTPLHGWFLPAEGEAKGSILFLHGNAQNISYHFGSVYWLPERGYNVFMFDYRGFGRSGGEKDLDGVYLDAEAALAHLRSRSDVDPDRLFVFGQSIGGAVTTWLMAHDSRVGVRAVILEGAFSDFRRITREKLGEIWFAWPFRWPLSFLIPNRYSPERVIGKITPTPLLIVHGTVDSIVPFHHARYLYRAAGDPKTLWVVEGAEHISAFVPQRPEWRDRLVGWLNDRVSPANSVGE